jgi:hypothetical protein
MLSDITLKISIILTRYHRRIQLGRLVYLAQVMNTYQARHQYNFCHQHSFSSNLHLG